MMPSLMSHPFISPLDEKSYGVFADGLPELAFPYDNDIPAHEPQSFLIPDVAFPVADELGLPVVRVRAWHPEAWMSFVHVPEASVNEHSRPVFREDYIGRAGITFVVLAVTEACCEEPFADVNFGLGVRAPYSGHVVVSLLRR